MDWHKRYQQQARWTHQSRAYLYRKARLPHAQRIIDVGCGTGALLMELPDNPAAAVFGLDISHENLLEAASNADSVHLTQADAHHLPFQDESMDICLCHYTLLWVDDPAVVVREMSRLLVPGGRLLLLAEPDYGGRIDHPPELAEIGRLQAEALTRQGADPNMGRQLSALLHRANLTKIETGVLGGLWSSTPDLDEIELEWQVLTEDLQELTGKVDLDRLRGIDLTAWQRGERVLYVPTFYGYGVKK